MLDRAAGPPWPGPDPVDGPDVPKPRRTAVLLLAVAMVALAGRGDGHHLGHRHADPKHRAGDWHPKREDETPAEQQGSGRPWRGVRTNLDTPRETS